MTLSPSALTKILFFDCTESEYGDKLANYWSDYDLLMKYIRLGLKRQVEQLLDFGCRVDKPGAGRFSTPLYMALKKGWTTAAKKMVASGARIFDDEFPSDSPLRYVFLDNKLIHKHDLINDMLSRYLLLTKADFVHEDGLSFFHIACAAGQIKYVEDFLYSGWIDVNHQVSNSAAKFAGYTALHFAAKFERSDVIQLLLKYKANPYVRDVNGITPLNCAFSDEELTGNDDPILSEGLSFFHMACAKGKLKYVEDLLVGAHVDVNCQVSNTTTKYAGYTALHLAIEFEQNDLIKLLLKHKANPCVQDINGSTPLHLAFYRQNFEAIDWLLAADQDKKDIVNNSGLSHFMIACTTINSFHPVHYLWKARRFNLKDDPSILISKRVKLLSKYSYAGYSPLHFAAEFGRLDTVQLLLAHRANCCAITRKLLTPAELAQRNRHEIVFQMLEHYCPDKRSNDGANIPSSSFVDSDTGYSSSASHTLSRSSESLDSSSYASPFTVESIDAPRYIDLSCEFKLLAR